LDGGALELEREPDVRVPQAGPKFVGLGSLGPKMALATLAANFSATQSLRLKDTLELEGRLAIGLLGLFFVEQSLLFRYRVSIRH
jgi:NADH:ubiquinone oxidoreductase subunit 2 (subunit N)